MYNPENDDTWWTAPAEDESDGRLVMVTGRRADAVKRFRANPKFKIRVTINWPYDSADMPDEATAEMMCEVTDRLNAVLAYDPVAVMTGIYTGAGLRQWVFYTLSTNIFGRKLNEALADLPLLPLTIEAENDPEWEEFDEMSQSALQS